MRSVILPSLAPLLKKHPQVQLQIQTRELHDLLPLLKSGEIDFIINDQNLEREELESHLLGIEHNVLVEKKDYSGPDIYLDHDEKDQTTTAYLRQIKIKGPLHRRYLDDVYGLIDGVKLGLGRAVLPIHLIGREKSLRILHPKQSQDIGVHLHYFKQPFYSKLHQLIVKELTASASSFLKVEA